MRVADQWTNERYACEWVSAGITMLTFLHLTQWFFCTSTRTPKQGKKECDVNEDNVSTDLYQQMMYRLEFKWLN